MALAGRPLGSSSGRLGPPRFDYGPWRGARIEDLFPANERFFGLGGNCCHARREPALQGPGACEPTLSYELVCSRASLPLCSRALVPAYVDVRRAKKLHYLVEDVGTELGSAFLHVQHVLADAPVCRDLEGLAAVAELWVGSYGGLHVARHVYLRYNRNVAASGVGAQLSEVGLGVKTAVGLAVFPSLPLVAGRRLSPPRAYLD